MDIPRKLQDKQREFDLSTFEVIRETEFRPTYDLIGLKYLRDKAGHERNLRELYRGRPSYELLQNADDAHSQKATFILADDGLVFAHDGHWFTVDNFRSLADGWSDKDPDKCIGHKGLGFRSVLDITPSPYLVKVDERGFFAVKFTWALNNGHIQESFKKNPESRERYKDWTQHGQLACPIMAIPGTAKKNNLGGATNILDRLVRGQYGQGYTTMFWFPAKDPEIDPKVLHELAPSPITAGSEGKKRLLRFIEDEVSTLLPFLSSVRSVSIYEGSNSIGKATLRSMSGGKNEGEITTEVEARGKIRTASFFQARYQFDIPPDVKRLSDTPKAVQEMRNAEVVLSVRLNKGCPEHDQTGRFHVYFPTDESTGLGFFVHGDFFVKPDRTRLMEGGYNEWLIGHAAQKAANDFLSKLLTRYEPRDAFAALSPAAAAATWASKKFVSIFSAELSSRQKPFVPGKGRLFMAHEVAVPPEIDREGFWDMHFGSYLDKVLPASQTFLAPEQDNQSTRQFLLLAGIKPINPDLAIMLTEVGGKESQNAGWWYDCLAFIARHPKLSQMTRDDFAGRRLVPTDDCGVVEVPTSSGRVICLPPTDDAERLHVPECFSSVFVFLAPALSEILRGERAASVCSWVLDRFRVARFEATDLLPRAVGAVAPRLFSSEITTSALSLGEAWMFLFKMTRASRGIKAQEFWRSIGRFPILAATTQARSSARQCCLIPAFLAYWPDSFVGENDCMHGVSTLRRLDEGYVKELVEKFDIPFEELRRFFEELGVSASPKLLTYRRLAVGGEDVEISPDGPKTLAEHAFTGDRQRDENIAVLQTLGHGPLWNGLLNDVRHCDHNAAHVLGTVTLLQGLDACVAMASAEYSHGDKHWEERLKRLAFELPVESIESVQPDSVYCRGGNAGGHSLPAGSCVRRQLANSSWLPSSLGPASGSASFVRQSTRRFISSARSGEELGDLILHYFVVDSLENAARFGRLGVQILEDAPSAEPSVLVRALHDLGERLSSDWGRNEILGVRARWRLVRGAIQEAYRCLNRADDDFEFPASMKWAVRLREGATFKPLPLYYAEPGSAVEQAFLEVLPLLDVDRAYRRLFDIARIIRLETGQTVEEHLLRQSDSQEHVSLRDELVQSLSPYLLATLVAKAEQPKRSELVVRRLKEWFSVRIMPTLEVSFVFEDEKKYETTARFPHFYLQTQLERRDGAIQERHYTLYVAGDASVPLFALDADALGEGITPIFLDGIGNDLAGLFPRIVSRFKEIRGDRKEMEDFMYLRLGISKDAMDMARAMLTGEVADVPPLPPPPPVQPLTCEPFTALTDCDIADTTNKFSDTLRNAENSFYDALMMTRSGKSGVAGVGIGTGSHGQDGNLKFDEPTPEQRRRGENGEEEIKRRLSMPGGWAGMILVTDKRLERCGYDFLCEKAGSEVKIEVKTFSRNGRVIFTPGELLEAAASGPNYFLLGVLDDGGPAIVWETMLIQNPFPVLVKRGKLSIKTNLEAPASDLFDL